MSGSRSPARAHRSGTPSGEDRPASRGTVPGRGAAHRPGTRGGEDRSASRGHGPRPRRGAMAAQRDLRGPVDDKKGERGRTKKAQPRPLDRERVSPCRPAAQRAQRVSTSAESSGPESTSAGMRAKCAGGSMTTVSRRERRSPRTRSRSLRCWKERPRAPRPWGPSRPSSSFWRAGRPPGASNVCLPDGTSEVAAGRWRRAGPNGSGEGKRRGRRRGSFGDRRSRGEGGRGREPLCGAPGARTRCCHPRREQGRSGLAGDWWPGRRGTPRDPSSGGRGLAWVSHWLGRPMTCARPCSEEGPSW